MKVTTYSDSRANLASLMDAVTDDHEEAVITRKGRPPVVLMSMADYESMKETAYLLSTPANARRLLASIADVRAGNVEVHDLIDPDE